MELCCLFTQSANSQSSAQIAGRMWNVPMPSNVTSIADPDIQLDACKESGHDSWGRLQVYWSQRSRQTPCLPTPGFPWSRSCPYPQTERVLWLQWQCQLWAECTSPCERKLVLHSMTPGNTVENVASLMSTVVEETAPGALRLRIQRKTKLTLLKTAKAPSLMPYVLYKPLVNTMAAARLYLTTMCMTICVYVWLMAYLGIQTTTFSQYLHVNTTRGLPGSWLQTHAWHQAHKLAGHGWHWLSELLGSVWRPSVI